MTGFLTPLMVASAATGMTAGGVGAFLFHRYAPRAALDRARSEAASARHALQSYDGEFEGAAPLMRASLKAALQPLTLSLKPALIAAAPAVLLYVVLDMAVAGRSVASELAFIAGAFPVALAVQAFLKARA